MDIENRRIMKKVRSVLKNERKTLRWAGTIFEEYELAGSNVVRGVIGEAIVWEYLEILGYKPKGRANSQHDMVVNGIKIEVKTSVPSVPKSYYDASFTHISPCLDWDVVVFLTGKPGSVFCQWMTKSEFKSSMEYGCIRSEVYSSKRSEGGSYYMVVMNSKHKDLEKITKEITHESFKSI